MSTEKNAVSINPAVEPPATTYHEAAQGLVEQLRQMRETIPHFVLPSDKRGRKSLATTASLPAEFIEFASVVRTNNPALTRGEKTSPAEARDLLSYADAYGPVAEEFEAMGRFLRFSIDAAKYTAGTEALMTYAVAQRLVKRPEHTDLVPHVAALRRMLGNRGKRAKANARKKQEQPAAPATSQEK